MKREEKTKLCPFKKIVEKSYNDHRGESTVNERFAPCAGERCMAYRCGMNGGKCARVETGK